MPTHPDLLDVFADGLVPEAFERPTSAFRTSVRQPVASMDEWVLSALSDALVFRYPQSGEHVHGIILAQEGELRWEWHHEPDHPMAWFVRRVRRELSTFGSPWVLVAHVPGPRFGWVQHEDDEGHLDEVLELVEPAWDMAWYAEVRRPSVVDVRSGREHWHLEEHRRSTVTDPDQDPFASGASALLRGHASRRRFRRRRT